MIAPIWKDRIPYTDWKDQIPHTDWKENLPQGGHHED